MKSSSAISVRQIISRLNAETFPVNGYIRQAREALLRYAQIKFG